MSPFLQLTPFALIYKQYFFLGSLNNWCIWSII
jgi:hypothetical protein